MMPLFHVGGIVRNLWAPVFSGGSAIMCPGFDSTAFWPIVMACGATWYVFLGFPPVFLLFVDIY